jgi:hypothetical protein
MNGPFGDRDTDIPPGAASIGLPWGKWHISGLHALMILLLAACAVRLWLMPLPSSFWIDEMVTAFIVEKGADHPSLALAPQVTKSIYYWLPAMMRKWIGASEALYRIPSVLALALAVIFIVLLSRRLIHPSSGWFAAFACAALSGLNYQATDARPYALGTCIIAASLYWLIRWLDAADWKHAVLFVCLASLVWRVHLIFWPVYILFAVYALFRLARGETAVSIWSAAAAGGALGLLLMPVAMEALPLFHSAQVHVIEPLPSLNRLVRSLRLDLIAYCGAGALVLTRWPAGLRVSGLVRRMAAPRALPASAPFPGNACGWSTIVLIAGWWVCQPFCLFLFSHLTGTSVFVTRYFSVSLPGAALVATGVSGLFLSAAHWRRASALLGLAVLLWAAQLRNFNHDPSDWRGAVRAMKELCLPPSTPVICPSPFIEARPPAWNENAEPESFLYAHLCYYPAPGTPCLLPYEIPPEAEEYAARITRATLARSDRFLIYGGLRIVTLWRQWFARQPELAGWSPKSIGDFGAVGVVLFERIN